MRVQFMTYLDKLFAEIPPGAAVTEAKEELLAGMLERYDDYRAQGMEERAAYDAVIDSIGDIHELFDALRAGQRAQDLPPYAQPTGGPTGERTDERRYQPQAVDDFGIGEFVDGVVGFAKELFTGVFSGPYGEEVRLVNRRSFSLDGLHALKVEMASETVDLFAAEDGQLTILEYMNRDNPALFAEISEQSGVLRVRTGRRVSVFGLRSRMEIYLPVDWHGALSVGTMSGAVKSGEHWRVGGLSLKSVSGNVELRGASCPQIALGTTSGSVLAEHLEGALTLSSISGSVKVDRAAGHGELKTVSGSVRARFAGLDGDLHASSVSGSVRLELPPDSSFEFEGKSTSGGVHTGFDHCLNYKKRTYAHGYVGAPPHVRVTAKTVSGSIRVNDW